MKDRVNLAFVGDIMCTMEQTKAVRKSHGAYDDVFLLARDLWRDADYVLGNLETPIAGGGFKYTSEAALFNTPKAFAKAVKRAGIDFVATANNHCLDRGLEGLDATLDALDDLGLDHSGTFRSRDEAERIFIKDIAGFKIAVLASTYGTNSESGTSLLPKNLEWKVDLSKSQRRAPRNIAKRIRHAVGCLVPKWIKITLTSVLASLMGKTPQPPDYIPDNSTEELSGEDKRLHLRFMDKIRRAKSVSDFVIVMPHAGGQYNPGPGAYQKMLVRACLEAGADLVVSGHSHTPLRTEWMADALVAYSLGNLTFTPRAGWYLGNTLADYGVVLNVGIDTKRRCLDAVSFSVVKSVVGNDGVSRVIPVDRILAQSDDPLVKERLIMENEVVVNRVRGDATTVLPAAFYELKVR